MNMNAALCPVCQEHEANRTSTPGGGNFDCPCCGGFALEHELLDQGRVSIGDNERIKLKHILCEHRLRSRPRLFIASRTGAPVGELPRTTVDELLYLYPKEPLEYFDRALENLECLTNHPVATVPLVKYNWAALFSERDNAAAILRQLADLGYISLTGTHVFQILPKGWMRLQSIKQPGRFSKQAFVAMRFDESHAEIFDRGYKPAIEEADGGQTKAFIVNRKEHNNKIDDQIIAEIRRSRYLIADYTGHRPNVYYEAGFALGLNLPVIWCISATEQEKPHFDTRQYSYIKYNTPEDLKQQLINRIRATIT